MKKWLFIVHRWIGIATCLLFAVWFLSGLVMVYVPFPELTAEEEIAQLPKIAFDRVRVQPDGDAKSLRLEMQGDRPVWRVRTWDGGERTVSASTSSTVENVDVTEASSVAAAFGGAAAVRVDLLERDQWTVAGRFNRHRPLWKVTLAGEGSRVLYVSSRTGAVVLDTDARERFWNWVGSVPHWIYPTVLRQEPATWRQVVMWTSGLGILAAVTGIWIGVLRQRRGRTPYRGVMAWHHIAGLAGGITLLFWIFSGWLSVDPFHLFDSPGLSTSDQRTYAGPHHPGGIDWTAVGTLAPDARRIELVSVAGTRLLLASSSAHSRLVLNAETLTPAGSRDHEFLTAARRLLPGARPVSIETLTEPDAYWYGVHAPPTLPVVRLRFDDAASTWVHLDAVSGQIVGVIDRRGRIYRWAFDLLHRWDLNFLTRQPLLRESLLWLLSTLGLVTSGTGIWIGWKRLRQ